MRRLLHMSRKRRAALAVTLIAALFVAAGSFTQAHATAAAARAEARITAYLAIGGTLDDLCGSGAAACRGCLSCCAQCAHMPATTPGAAQMPGAPARLRIMPRPAALPMPARSRAAVPRPPVRGPPILRP